LKMKKSPLFFSLFFCMITAHADQAGGGVAQTSAIFMAGRGNIFDEELPASEKQPKQNNTTQPAASAIVAAAANTPPLALATPAPRASEAPLEPNELPLARGNLSEAPAPALTDNLARNLAFSLGGIAISTSLDKSGDTFALNHSQNSAVKSLTKVGDALPFIAIGAAALAALDTSDPRLSRTGFSALQAGGASALSSFGLKYVVDRARPEADLGPTEFHNSALNKGDSSFPSIHTATLWGIVTPFAKEYDMPWLYGLAALTNFSRVAGRKHWVSDTVAGSLIGYWAGDIAWQRNKPRSESSAQVYLGERSVTVAWPF
jgi:membrane-associated phospholipid phosphatase